MSTYYYKAWVLGVGILVRHSPQISHLPFSVERASHALGLYYQVQYVLQLIQREPFPWRRASVHGLLNNMNRAFKDQ